MAKTQRLGGGLIATLAAMTLLAGCAAPAESGPEAEENRPESDGSNLPFDLPASGGSGGGSSSGGSDTEPSESPSDEPSEEPEETSDGGSGDSGGSGGGETVVKFGDVDLSDLDWNSTCMDDYLMADDMQGNDYNSDYNSLSVSFNSDGTLDYVMVYPSDTSQSSLYFSADLNEGAEPTASFDGSTVEAKGEGFLDYDTTNVVEFEIKMSCDTTL